MAHPLTAQGSTMTLHQNRHGFTLIELVGVLFVITILGMLSIPAALAAAQRGATNQVLVDLERVAAQARAAALRTPAPIDPTTAAHYGVILVQDGGDRYIALLKGTAMGDAGIELADGQPVLRVAIPHSVDIMVAYGSEPPQPLAGSIGWFFRFGDGAPILSPGNQVAIGIGTPMQPARDGQKLDGSVYWNFAPPLPKVEASPVCTILRVRAAGSADGVLGTGFAIYRNGLAATDEARVAGQGMQ